MARGLLRRHVIHRPQKRVTKFNLRGLNTMTILEKKRAALKAYEEKASKLENGLNNIKLHVSKFKVDFAVSNDMDKSTKALHKEYLKTADKLLKVLGQTAENETDTESEVNE